MNNIKEYEEFLNEGFYDFVNKKVNQNDWLNLWFLAFLGSFCWFGLFFNNNFVREIFVIAANMSYVPLTANIVFKLLARELYNSLRSAGLLGITNKRFKIIKDLVEKYPDIEEELENIKLRMISSIKKNNKTEISSCINDIYKLSRNLKKREKLSNIFNLTEEEKQIIKNQEKKLKTIDPYREENWENE